MPLNIVNGDITALKADVIVNATNRRLAPRGGGVDGAIHAAAGPGLAEECAALGGCEPGEAKATGAYDLSARYVIHTVGPVWRGGNDGEEEILSSCYRSSLKLAAELGAESVAFPLVAAGNYHYPRDSAMRVAVDTISSFLLSYDGDMDVTLALYGGTARRPRRRLRSDLDRYIVRNMREPEEAREALCDNALYHSYPPEREERRKPRAARKEERKETAVIEADEARGSSFFAANAATSAPVFGSLSFLSSAGGGLSSTNLDVRLRYLDESFSEMVFRIVKERNLDDPDVYKRANIDRKLFSKIRINKDYAPSKRTALALAIGLRLDMEQTSELLMKAGYALSNSNVTDVIVQYFISRGEYDIFRINEALFEHDQQILGSSAA